MMGVMSLCRKWLHRGVRSLRQLFVRSQGNNDDAPEQMAFIGSESAWAKLQTVCERSKLPVRRVSSIDEATPPVIFIVFEVTESGRCYHSMLWQMTQASRSGKKLIIGTFNPQSGRLILPHDVFC